MSYKFPRLFTKEFLLLYREKECLWRKKHPLYRNKAACLQAKQELLEKLKEKMPYATVDDVSYRLENWRGPYRQGVIRLIKSTQSGYKGPIYVPQLWFFPLLTFLHEDEYPSLPALCQSLGLPKPENVDTREPVYKMYKGEDESKTDLDAERYHAITEDLLHMYRKYPFMWKKKFSTPLKPGELRARKYATRALLAKFREIYPGANEKALSRRLYSFRVKHIRELKRLLDARERGKIYKPKTWFFKIMTYMNKYEAKERWRLLLPDEIEHTDDEMETIESLNEKYSDDDDDDDSCTGITQKEESSPFHENWDTVEAEEVSAAESSDEEDLTMRQNLSKRDPLPKTYVGRAKKNSNVFQMPTPIKIEEIAIPISATQSTEESPRILRSRTIEPKPKRMKEEPSVHDKPEPVSRTERDKYEEGWGVLEAENASSTETSSSSDDESSKDPLTPPSEDHFTPPLEDHLTPPSKDPLTPPSKDPLTQPSIDPLTQPSNELTSVETVALPPPVKNGEIKKKWVSINAFDKSSGQIFRPNSPLEPLSQLMSNINPRKELQSRTEVNLSHKAKPKEIKREVKREKKLSNIEMSRQSVSCCHAHVPAPVPTEPKDRFDVVGENVACKLRYLSTVQRIHAEKMINDILYYAELKGLDRYSAVVIAETAE